MAACVLQKLFQLSPRSVCSFHTSSQCSVSLKWRKEKGLPKERNQEHSLVEWPDFTFTNGRPTPVTPPQYRRIQKQREIVTQAVQMISEMDYAVERFNNLTKEEQQRRQLIIDSKLKPKGQALLKPSIKK